MYEVVFIGMYEVVDILTKSEFKIIPPVDWLGIQAALRFAGESHAPTTIKKAPIKQCMQVNKRKTNSRAKGGH